MRLPSFPFYHTHCAVPNLITPHVAFTITGGEAQYA